MRNILFKSIFFSGLIFICVLFIPSLVLPKKIVLFGGKLFGYWSSICLRFIYSTKIIVIGKENIVSNKSFFIACSHQSMFETFFLQTIFNSPIFILKKELLNIPVFGWYLRKSGSISINRNKITKENLNFIEKVKKKIQETGSPLIIFPQATRVLPEDRVPFKKGVGRIYKELNMQCQPVAIDSGKVWPKNSTIKANKTITVSILDPIDPGLEEKEFVRILENRIYSELGIN